MALRLSDYSVGRERMNNSLGVKIYCETRPAVDLQVTSRKVDLRSGVREIAPRRAERNQPSPSPLGERWVRANPGLISVDINVLSLKG